MRVAGLHRGAVDEVGRQVTWRRAWRHEMTPRDDASFKQLDGSMFGKAPLSTHTIPPSKNLYIYGTAQKSGLRARCTGWGRRRPNSGCGARASGDSPRAQGPGAGRGQCGQRTGPVSQPVLTLENQRSPQRPAPAPPTSLLSPVSVTAHFHT